ncbi:MAG: DNA translocase FtsK [Chloroflexota bacterium]|nr:DNA translocase FtsK [Chloroflexota bacterium]
MAKTPEKPTVKAPSSGASNGKANSPTTGRISRAAVPTKAVPPPPPNPVERYTVKPEFWDSIFDVIPPWADEIVAIVLIVFGIVSLLSLLNLSSDAAISLAWSGALALAFGYGSTLVCFGIFALGVLILLPKLGIEIKFPTRRILAIEIGFLSILALLHLLVPDPELRTLARIGRGGGQAGWALSSSVTWLLGSSVSVALYSLLLAISAAVFVGVDRRKVGRWLSSIERGFAAFAVGNQRPRRPRAVTTANRMDEALTAVSQMVTDAGTPAIGAPSTLAQQRVKMFSMLRVRVDPTRLPPSQRPGAHTPEWNETDAQLLPLPTSVTASLPLTGTPEPKPAPEPSIASQHPMFTRRESQPLPSFNAIGTIKGRKSKGSPVLVERPDGRIKRYFPVEGMREAKTTNKREATLPPMDLLRDIALNLPDEQEINQKVVLIENTLLEFDIDVDVVDVRIGPTVTQYAVQPFREMSAASDGEIAFSRTRVNKIASLANDLALSLSAKRLRIEAPVPGESYVGVEVPNRNPSVVSLRSVYESKLFRDEADKKRAPLFIPLGRDVAGQPVGIDLASMPHLLIAGTTGSGKSVAIAAIASALLLENAPDVVKMIMLDPKMVELSRFNGLPHLLGPVETDQERIIGVLRWCTREMDRRYKMLEENAARNIDIYNSRLGRRRKEEFLPYIVIMIDEIGDLMMTHPDETEKTVTRLAQMARAVGMHLVVATQRPSVDVITGLIKANFPARMSFAVTSGTDSRVILDSTGAENLMGKGDMLFLTGDAAAPRRVQGCFVSDDEVRSLTAYWKDWERKQIIDGKAASSSVPPWERGLTRREFLAETDPMLEQAIELVIAEGEASASLIQRRLGVGYPRAARMMDLLQEIGIVGEAKAGERGREVLIKPGKDPFKDLIDKRMNQKSE